MERNHRITLVMGSEIKTHLNTHKIETGNGNTCTSIHCVRETVRAGQSLTYIDQSGGPDTGPGSTAEIKACVEDRVVAIVCGSRSV